jgi:hypothetical protein
MKHRNYQVYSMNLRCKGEVMRDRRERRVKENDDVRKYVEEWSEDDGFEDDEDCP